MLAFARDGYEGTTNRALAEACGLTSPALYHYFPSKAELYAAVYEAVYDRVFSAFDVAIRDHDTLSGQFVAVLDAISVFNRNEDPTLAAFVVGAAGETQRHPELKDLLKPMRRRNTDFFRRLVACAAARGELPPDVDLRAVGDLLNAVATGLVRLAAVTGDARRHASAVDVLQRVLDGTLLRRVGDSDDVPQSGRDPHRHGVWAGSSPDAGKDPAQIEGRT